VTFALFQLLVNKDEYFNLFVINDTDLLIFFFIEGLKAHVLAVTGLFFFSYFARALKLL